MKKNIILTIFSIFLVLGLMGCKSEEMQSFSFDSSEVSKIEIKTECTPVSIVKGSGEAIEISYTKDVATIQNGVLTINAPTPKPGINLNKEPTMIITIPSELKLPYQIESKFGNINVENVSVSNLTINSQDGNIILTGIEGYIAAKSEMGSIKMDNSVADDIERLGDLGQKLDTQFGESESEISLYSNTGNIELK